MSNRCVKISLPKMVLLGEYVAFPMKLDKLFLPHNLWEISNWGKYFQSYFAKLRSEYAQILRKLQHLFHSWLQILSYFRHYDSYDDDDDDGTADEVERANVLTAPKTVLPEWAEWKWDPLEPFLTLFPFRICFFVFFLVIFSKMRPSGASPHTLPFSVSVTFLFVFLSTCERQDVDFEYWESQSSVSWSEYTQSSVLWVYNQFFIDMS